MYAMRRTQTNRPRYGKPQETCGRSKSSELALRELEPLASALLTILLTLMLAGIPSEEACCLELTAQLGVEFNQRAGDAHARGACLTTQPTAIGEDQHIELLGCFGSQQRTLHQSLRRLAHKVVGERTFVDFDLALAMTQK